MQLRWGASVSVWFAVVGCVGPVDLSAGGDPFNAAGDAGAELGADAGVFDDGGPDMEPDPTPDPDPSDGGPPDGQLLGEPCDPLALRCAEGLYCLDGVERLDGTDDPRCVLSCGVVDGNTLVETPEVCGEYEACNTILDDTITFALAAVCLPIQYSRDYPCYAFEDPDVCALERECLATEVSAGAAGEVVVDAMRCKDTCVLGAPEEESPCLFGATCQPDPIGIAVGEAQLVNPDDPASTISCDPAGCAAGSPGCPCDINDGYTCTAVASPICARPRGICGEVAPYLDEGDAITTDAICNETNGSTYCDRAPLREVAEDPALAICAGFATPTVEGDGICIALCHQPAFDYDGNGTVDLLAGERELAFNCPEDWSCTHGYARSIGLIATGPAFVPCEPSVCPAGSACPECAGGAECVDEPYLLAPSCAAVFGTCHPDPIVVDGGPTDGGAIDGGVDAGDGQAGRDAGAPFADAGGTPTDAGAPLDAGVHANDAG